MDFNSHKLWEIVKDRGNGHAAVHGVSESDMTEQLNNDNSKFWRKIFILAIRFSLIPWSIIVIYACQAVQLLWRKTDHCLINFICVCVCVCVLHIWPSDCTPLEVNCIFTQILVRECLDCMQAPSYLTLQPQGLQPPRLLCPWDFWGKNTGVGYHFPLQGIFPT